LGRTELRRALRAKVGSRRTLCAGQPASVRAVFLRVCSIIRMVNGVFISQPKDRQYWAEPSCEARVLIRAKVGSRRTLCGCAQLVAPQRHTGGGGPARKMAIGSRRQTPPPST